MAAPFINPPSKWSLILFTLITALILSHVNLIENGFDLPVNYIFPFSSFAINVFYTGSAILLFQTLIDYLDRKIPWTEGASRRMLLQGGISIFIYLLLQSFIIYGLEPFFNQNNSTPIRIIFTFSLGFTLVILLNLIYLIPYFQKREEDMGPVTDFSQFLHGTMKGRKVTIPKSAFLLFYIEEGIIIGVTENQEKILLKESLLELENSLDKQYFFRANRKQLIAKKAITKAAFENSASGIVQLDFPKEVISISRRRIASFRKWLGS